MAEKRKLVTKAEFARRTKVSKARISQLVKTGVLRTTKSGRLDFDKSIARIRANRDPSRSSKIVPDEEEGIIQGLRRARAAREVWTAKTVELDFKIKSGMKIDAMEIKSKLIETCRVLRDAFDNLPARVAGVFAGETDSKKIENELSLEIKAAFQNFKGGMSKIVILE